MALLKRMIPTRLLVWMDAVAQLSGDLWQLSPSVFARCRAMGQPKPLPDEVLFRCPAFAFSPLPDTPPEIVCPGCARTFAVKDGIYDFRLDPPASEA
jgi:hypothetical protein